MFHNPFLEDGRRKTYAVSFLFSKDEQYGLYVMEPTRDNLIATEPVSFQISSAIQTIDNLRKHQKIALRKIQLIHPSQQGIIVFRIIVGFDDSPFSALMEPSLTTTRAESTELGYRAIREACKLKSGEYKDLRIETAFIVRESCGGRDKDSVARIEKKFKFDPDKDDINVLVQQISEVLKYSPTSYTRLILSVFAKISALSLKK